MKFNTLSEVRCKLDKDIAYMKKRIAIAVSNTEKAQSGKRVRGLSGMKTRLNRLTFMREYMMKGNK